MATRTQVAQYLTGKLTNDRTEAVREAAAWLVATGRERQARYLARDVAKALSDDGYVFAHVTTARPVTTQTRAAVEQFLRTETGVRELELEFAVDERVIGGLRLETPTAQLDATVSHKLAKLVEGAQA